MPKDDIEPKASDLTVDHSRCEILGVVKPLNGRLGLVVQRVYLTLDRDRLAFLLHDVGVKDVPHRWN